jgi:predicted small secreted protein
MATPTAVIQCHAESINNSGVRENSERTQMTGEIMINRIIVMAFAAALLVMASTGCHTARGFGEDMEHAGEKIQDKTN